MIKKFIVSLTLISLMGCSVFQKPDTVKEVEVKVETIEIPLRIIQPMLPPEIQLVSPKIHVITTKNLDEKKSEIEKIIDGEFVVVAMTLDDYENMAANIQEITRYIKQQRKIINYYMEATKIDQPTESK